MKKDINQELAEMLTDFPADDLINLLKNMVPLWQLFDVEDESDWVVEEVGECEEPEIRMLRSFYLVSKLADNCSAALCRIKVRHGGLWKRMEKVRDDLKGLTKNE